MSTHLITCPNCNAKMNLGGECLECGHSDDMDCDCEFCDLRRDPNTEDDSDDDLDIDGDDEE